MMFDTDACFLLFTSRHKLGYLNTEAEGVHQYILRKGGGKS